MTMVGTPERDEAVELLRRAYVKGYLPPEELDRRVGVALRAESSRELRSSLSGLPGATADLVLATRVEPAFRRLRGAAVGWAGRALNRFARSLWIGISAVVLVVFGIWSLASGPSLRLVVVFVLVWLLLSLAPGTVWQKTRRFR